MSELERLILRALVARPAIRWKLAARFGDDAATFDATLKSLMARGLALPNPAGVWRITDAGHRALGAEGRK